MESETIEFSVLAPRVLLPGIQYTIVYEEA